jgi:membrane protein
LTQPPGPPRPSLKQRIGARVEPIVAAILGVPRIAMAHRVWDRYSASSGPLLARGLAYTTLFTLVPALLLIASVAGLLVADPATRVRIAGYLAAQFPPLKDVLNGALDTALAHAGAFSLISGAVLAWSASGLVRDLDDALGILFREAGIARSLLRTGGEVLVVAIAVVGIGLTVALATIPGPLSELSGLGRLRVTAVLPLVVAFGLAFRFLPRSRPGWRDAIVPAVWVGLASSALTGAFSVVAPVLFGSAELYGAFAGIFVGLVWLSYVTQLFLVGAAWVAVRADERSPGARPSRADPSRADPSPGAAA